MEEKPPDSPISPDHQLPPPNGHPPKQSKKRRTWVWVVLLLVFALIFVLVLRHQDKTATRAGGRGAFGGPVTVTVTTAKKGDIGVYLDAIGTVTPIATTTLYNQVTGVVTAVHYREGQMVRKGDPLVDIDPRQFQAQVLTAEGNLVHDTNVLALARMDLERYRQAWAKNAIPKQQLDDQEKTVLQAEGLVKADQGTLDFNNVQLSYCHITSPITGRVGLRLVDPGNLVQSSGSTVLAVVTQMEPTTIVFTLAQDHLGLVLPQVRRKAGLTVDAYDRTQETKIATGKLLALDNQVDTTTGTVKLRALFDNKKDTLYPNQFVNTRLLVTTQHDMTLIPSSTIQHNGEISFVYVIQNGAAHVHNVKPGTTDGGITAVEGVNPGDVIATSSFERLQDGAKTIIAKKPASPGTSESNAP